MKITSKLSDFENKNYLDKISSAIKYLDSRRDNLFFVEQMVSLSSLLSNFDQKLNNSFSAIDENAQDPSYFIAAYFDTKNLTEALWVYRIVRSLTRYILLSDRYYETENESYALLAKQARELVNGFLQFESDAQHLIYSMDYLLEQFSAFWKFEQIIKRRILRNYAFSYTELKHFNLSKSSDASLVYAKVLDAKLPSFNENVSLVLHYNQAMLDIQDDWEDIVDDVQEDMPNIFTMAAVGNIPYDKIKVSSPELIRKVVLNETNQSGGPVSRLVNHLHASSKSVSIPESFAFLKTLSDRYANTLRRNLSLGNS
jgi:hypothetical protein